MRYVTIHTSLTPPSMDIGASDIRRWHRIDRGWRDIGYHRVIKRDGTIEQGRPDGQTGAHVGGFNTDNYGVCMVGGLRQGGNFNNPADFEDNYTDAQWVALWEEMLRLHDHYPGIVIMGHNGWPGHEARGCPCFDWRTWRDRFWETLREPAPQMPSHWIDEVDVER